MKIQPTPFQETNSNVSTEATLQIIKACSCSSMLASVVNRVGSFLDSSFVGLIRVKLHGWWRSQVHLFHRISLVGVDNWGFEGDPFESKINGAEPRSCLRLKTQGGKTSQNKDKDQSFPVKQGTHFVWIEESQERMKESLIWGVWDRNSTNSVMANSCESLSHWGLSFYHGVCCI